MKMMDKVRVALVRLVFPLFRAFMLHTPDGVLAPLFRGLTWLAYLVTGDLMVRQALADVVEILESGPPASTTMRQLIASSPPEMIASIFVCLRRPSPFGI